MCVFVAVEAIAIAFPISASCSRPKSALLTKIAGCIKQGCFRLDISRTPSVSPHLVAGIVLEVWDHVPNPSSSCASH
ncbi:hypothetical protein K469DRAFT_298921, partial [Zopfia rhizophila CBS 207.26]